MGTNSIVPGYSVKERWPNLYWPIKRKDSTTDYPYMCLDSSNDRYPDVAYGRILAYTAQEANDMISKIIAYEKGLFSRSDIYNKAFLATAFWSNPEFSNGRFIPTLEDIYDILDQNEINAQRLYTTDWGIIPTTWDYYWNDQDTPLPSYLQYPQYPWNATAQDVMTAFESGVNLAVYNGHGGNDNWTAFPFTDAHCRQLTTPGSAPLIFSIGCSTANHTYHNCIVAELSRTTTRGIAVIASSNVTYLDYSDPLLIGMIDAIWPNTYTYNGWSDPIEHAAVHRLYDIMERGHSRVELEQGGGYWDRCNLSEDYSLLQYQRENFHVYGDPTINYNTERPIPFTGIQCTANERAVYVEVLASNLPAKIVVRRPRDGSIITRKVDPSSTSTMEGFNFSITDSVEVFVSGPNRIPYYEMITDDWSVVGPDSNKTGEIVEANYDSETQTVTVLCTLNATAGTPQFYSTDFFGNSNALTAIKQDNNRYVISLDKQKKGLCVISMQINGEIVSIHKLIKK